MVDVIATRTVRTKVFIKVLTFSAAGKMRYPEKGKLSSQVDGFFINNYSANEVWVNWDEEAAVKGGERIDAGDYRNIALRTTDYLSVYSDGAADSVILIGYREHLEAIALAQAPATSRGGGRGRDLGYEDDAKQRYTETVLRSRRG